MEGTYDILRSGDVVGQAVVTRQGLYWQFDCRCRLSGEMICRLEVQQGDCRENLGVPIPEKGVYRLTKKIPISRLGKGVPQIRVIPKKPETNRTFIPLSPEEPFRYLSRLKNASAERRDGQLGIRFKE